MWRLPPSTAGIPPAVCSQFAKFDDVAAVEALGDLAVRVTFDVAKPYPYGPFTGATSPILQKAQFGDCKGARAPECTEANFGPVGTGPFRVTEFRPNDVISLEANPHYRDPAKPAFTTATFKGGGDAAAAARAVLATGEFDYAWNLQLAPDVLRGMQAGGKGAVVSSFGTLVERLVVNLTDPSPERGGARSTRAHPHPFLTDRAVRKALSMAIDRRLLVEIGYGQAGAPGLQTWFRRRKSMHPGQTTIASSRTSTPRNACWTRPGGGPDRTAYGSGTACGSPSCSRPRPTRSGRTSRP